MADANIEAIALELVPRMERMIIHEHWQFEIALRQVMDAEEIVHLSQEERKTFETILRLKCIENSLERARLSRQSAKAHGLASGRIAPRGRAARFSGKDLAAGAEVEERRDRHLD